MQLIDIVSLYRRLTIIPRKQQQTKSTGDFAMSCRCHTRNVLDRRDNMCASHQHQQLLGGCGCRRKLEQHTCICDSSRTKSLECVLRKMQRQSISLSACREGWRAVIMKSTLTMCRCSEATHLIGRRVVTSGVDVNLQIECLQCSKKTHHTVEYVHDDNL